MPSDMTLTTVRAPYPYLRRVADRSNILRSMRIRTAFFLGEKLDDIVRHIYFADKRPTLAIPAVADDITTVMVLMEEDGLFAGLGSFR